MLLRLPLLIVLSLALVACGDGGVGSEATNPIPEETGLVFQRADGSSFETRGHPLVWCGPWNDVISQHALHVIGGLRHQAGDDWSTYWQLWATPRDVTEGTPVRFPGDYTFDDPSGVVFFVGDAETGNEASTTGEDSSGKIVFSQFSCDVGSPIEFTIDAVVDSEFGDADPIAVTGTFRGVVGDAPVVSEG
jgi:hypothetical protein